MNVLNQLLNFYPNLHSILMNLTSFLLERLQYKTMKGKVQCSTIKCLKTWKNRELVSCPSQSMIGK